MSSSYTGEGWGRPTLQPQSDKPPEPYIGDVIQKMFDDFSHKNNMGTLTLGEALIGRYYRLREGTYAGRVVIKCNEHIDGSQVVRFANGMTWKRLEELWHVLCEQVYPVFSESRNTIDYSEATWYDDCGGGPRHHEW